MLDTHVNNIKTKWKEVIKSFINENPEKWATLNTNLQKQTEKLDNFLEIYPNQKIYLNVLIFLIRKIQK